MQALSLEWARNMSCIDKGNKDMVDLACLGKVGKRPLIQETTKWPSPDREGPDEHNVSEPVYWWPHVDGDNLTDEPLTLIRQGKFKKVPVMMGTMKHEGGFFTAKNHVMLLRMFYHLKRFQHKNTEKLFRIAFKDKADQILRYYPLGEDEGKNEDSYVAMMTDFLFICPSLEAATIFSQHGQPTFVYSFDQVATFIRLGRCGKDYACHTWDLPLFWRPKLLPMNFEDKEMSKAFIQYTSNFIQHGDPNTMAQQHEPHMAKLTHWDAFEPVKQGVLSITFEPTMTTVSRTQHCAMWSKLGYRF
jgi:carboxylesterase type B